MHWLAVAQPCFSVMRLDRSSASLRVMASRERPSLSPRGRSKRSRRAPFLPCRGGQRRAGHGHDEKYGLAGKRGPAQPLAAPPARVWYNGGHGGRRPSAPGSSGFAYKPWKGAFYPEDLPDSEMLSYYSQRLGAVEINNTFYRLPKASVLEVWAAQTPPGFRFAIKASRRITPFRAAQGGGGRAPALPARQPVGARRQARAGPVPAAAQHEEGPAPPAGLP